MIKEKDGIHIDGDKKYVIDSRKSEGELNIVSHAHFDHLHLDDSKVVASDTTTSLAETRTGKNIENRKESRNIQLLNSGHIVGSRSVLVEEGRSILYTGDFSLRDRLYLDGFRPTDCDSLIIESTYGIENYRFPEYREIEARISDWLEENRKPLFLFGYSLGKAQKIHKIVENNTEKTVLLHKSVEKLTKAIEDITKIRFDYKSLESNYDLLEEPNTVFIGPTRLSHSDKFNSLVEKHEGLKAGFSGWAASDSYKYRGGYDKTFQLSDHADFDELVNTVRKCDPDKVYTTHGFDDAFASYLRKEHGYNARALKQNQSSLNDF